MWGWLLAGAGLAVALKKPDRPVVGRAAGPPGALATARPTIKRAAGLVTGKQLGEFPGETVGPAVEISMENGYMPVWLHVAQGYDLEWGACFFQWSKDLEKHGVKGSGKIAEWMGAALGTVMTWIVTASGLGFIVNRVCFRVLMPALKIHIAAPPLELIGPSEPRGIPADKLGPNRAGGYTINGWNPGTSRIGFNAKFTKWPLQWPPPDGKVGAAWIKNFGDLAGVGSDVYQVITAQNGEEKSWPMMSKWGWRAMFRLGGDFNLVAVVQDGELSNRATMDLFDMWKPVGSSGLQKGFATKKKATNRYR